MQIHLVETSEERGQYRALIEEEVCSGLLSFAHRRSAQQEWEKVWKGLNQKLVRKVQDALVRIHLAKSGTDKLTNGEDVRMVLADTNYASSLLSFVYKEHESAWADYWDKLMRIHLAGQGPFTIECKKQEEVKNFLTSFAYPSECRENEGLWADIPDLRPRVIIDSGAFTAWSSGKIIDPREYAEWALDFKRRWQDKMYSLYFMNLDVIGDQEASWRNQVRLEKMGLKPIPIVTYGADKKDLLRAITHYPYIALGGLVPYSRQKKKLQPWLDYCFGLIMEHRKKTGILPKTHLLGVTTSWTSKRYPCYSSDSSSWVACLRFGRGTEAGLPTIPRYKESKAALTTTVHVLRAEIQRFKRMEQEATKLWRTRGIYWDD